MRKILIAGIALAALPAAAMAQAAMTHFLTLQNNDILSSNLTGLDVYDDHNNDIATIKDIAFDSSKAVKGYVVSVGGVLDMGGRYVVVDPDSIKIKYDPSDKKWHANMNSSKDELMKAPEFKYAGQWNASKS